MIEFHCDACSDTIRMSDKHAGKRCRCNNCGQALTIPHVRTNAQANQLTEAGAGRPVSANANRTDLLSQLRNIKESSKEWTEGQRVAFGLASFFLGLLYIVFVLITLLMVGSSKPWLAAV